MRARAFAVVTALLVAAAGAGGATACGATVLDRLLVRTGSRRQPLARAHGTVVRRLPALHIAEVQPQGRLSASPRGSRACPGSAPSSRSPLVSPAPSPALAARLANGLPLEWEYGATQADAVPAAILRAASAVHDRGRRHGRRPHRAGSRGQGAAVFNVLNGRPTCATANGHGTFVASIAAGSVTNREGIAGFGGAAKLLIVKAGGADGSVHRRRRGGRDRLRRRSWRADHQPQPRRPRHLHGRAAPPSHYAASHGVLLVAAAGNEAQNGNPVEYPAALLQPVGSNGIGGIGLAVGASTMLGAPRALLELRLVPLAGRAGRQPARRASFDRHRLDVADRSRLPRLAARPLRARERHLLRGAAGLRRRGARLGGQPLPLRGGRGDDPQGDRLRRRRLDTDDSATACSTSPPPSRARPVCRSSICTACAPAAGSASPGAGTVSRPSG